MDRLGEASHLRQDDGAPCIEGKGRRGDRANAGSEASFNYLRQ
jgi:hypothetical protein